MLKGEFPVERFAAMRTPFYFYDLPLLRRTLDAVQAQLDRNPDFRVHYAVKANYNPRILSEIAGRGFGADCVSGGEIRAALEAGFPASEIVFAGVGKADWEIKLALQAGIAMFNVESVAELVRARKRTGHGFSIVACAEGAVSKDDKKLTEEEARKKKEANRYSTVSYAIAAEIERITGADTRVTVPGHYQRGGPPCPYDRLLATQFGTAAADLIVNKQYNRMVAIQSGKITSIPLDEAASKTKFLPVDHPIIQVARDIGICMGD